MERKLAAILNADVEGYSRLMGDDEAATVRTLTAYRDLMAALVRQHRGRVVDFTGDNFLAEFASVVDAVRCAVEIQEELRVRNAELPDHRKMNFRIGVNLGDVIVDGERIYGDGVNVAARVQGLADGGGVCISGTVWDQVKNKLAFSYETLGEHAVKNIAEPVRVYRVLLQPTPVAPAASKGRQRLLRPGWQGTVAAVAGLVLVVGASVAAWTFYFRPSAPPGLELPDKPSIAVLPFANIGGDPQQEHFADGMTEELITTLSKASGLFVIASNSVFTYKGEPVKVQQVSRELGVRYVLEGSVRKSGNRMRVTAQLVDGTRGHHLWAERYDRERREMFALQDELTQKIVTALEVKLTEGEQARVRRQTTAHGWRDLNPENPYPHAVLAAIYTLLEREPEARAAMAQALRLDPTISLERVARGSPYKDPKDLERTLEIWRRAGLK